MTQLPDHLRALLSSETRGELLRWTAQPDPRLAFRAAFAIYVIAVPWAAITIPTCGALLLSLWKGKPAGTWDAVLAKFGVLFALSFLAAGLVMLASPWWVRARARRTVYAITDKRILTLVAGRTLKATSIVPERIAKLERSERRDGSGSLKIVSGVRRDSDGDIVAEAEELTAIARVHDVERMVEDLRRASHTLRTNS